MKKINILLVLNYELYLNINRLYSYSDIDTYILLGGRGIGKTTSVLVKSIQNFNKNGEQFFYTRRYGTEIKECGELLSKITNDVHKFKLTKKITGYHTKDKEICGYSGAISSQGLIKSSGIDFSKVTTIILDEFTIMRDGLHHYLNNEYFAFMELVSSIVRTRKNYKIFIIGNNLDDFNPYFEALGLSTSMKQYIDRKRGLYFEMCETKEALLEEEKDTPLYKLNKGNAYFDYHYSNKTLSYKDAKIGKKDKKATLILRLGINKHVLNVYMQDNCSAFIEYIEINKYNDVIQVISNNDELNDYWIKRLKVSDSGAWLYQCYYTDYITYQDTKTASLFENIIKAM